MRAPDAQGGSGGAAGSSPNPSQTDRPAGFDRSRSSGKKLVAMELGELLYNKSEYIETVRLSRHLSPVSKPASL